MTRGCFRLLHGIYDESKITQFELRRGASCPLLCAAWRSRVVQWRLNFTGELLAGRARAELEPNIGLEDANFSYELQQQPVPTSAPR